MLNPSQMKTFVDFQLKVVRHFYYAYPENSIKYKLNNYGKSDRQQRKQEAQSARLPSPGVRWQAPVEAGLLQGPG